MPKALRDGFSSLGLNWGLVLVVLATNLTLALVVAAPLAIQLERDLAHTGASGSMMYGFDYEWWEPWSEKQEGPSRNLGPDLLGPGFAFKSLDALVRGQLPAGLFPDAPETRRGDVDVWSKKSADVDPTILGVAVVYMVAQIFLVGGLLGVFRSPRGGWTVRGLAHGSGFYFGRMFRVSLLALAGAGVVFALNLPFARWVDDLAREAVSERTALALLLGRHAVLLGALLLVHMVASYARVILVVEDRKSALLASLSSVGFCLRHFFAAAAQYVVVIAVGLVLLGLWTLFDVRFVVTGWKTQLFALAGFEALVATRIALRLGLLASQVELYRVRSRPSPEETAAALPDEGAPAAEAA